MIFWLKIPVIFSKKVRKSLLEFLNCVWYDRDHERDEQADRMIVLHIMRHAMSSFNQSLNLCHIIKSSASPMRPSVKRAANKYFLTFLAILRNINHFLAFALFYQST